ncbi:MAG: GSU2403 family nucleotidyltransferase fold protein, partial [Alphaproteobacteria bacterium]
DVDFLLDVRRRLTFAGREVSKSGLLGLLRKIDSSFATFGPNAIRAINGDGYIVDLIRPEPRDIITDKTPDRLGRGVKDLAGSPIAGVAWLMNAPRLSAIAIDEKGYPLRLVGVDPRAFALHKLWLSARPDRDPRKRDRDFEQALAAAEIAVRHLGLSFDDRALEALPQTLRDQAPQLTQYPDGKYRGGEGLKEEPGKLSPNW